MPQARQHGKSGCSQRGCDREECKRARARVVHDSYARRRLAVAEGTYDGPHGGKCAQYGCRCEGAELVRKEKARQAAVRRARPKMGRAGVYTQNFRGEDGMITVAHYPPRGVGDWQCDHCGQVFPHRPAA